MNREPTRRLFNGLAQLIVQSLDDSAGELVVEASAQGLAPARLVPVRATAPIATQPASAAPYNTVNYWRISPHSDVRPDPNQALADFDMNTWEYGDPPMLQHKARSLATGFSAPVAPRKKLADGSGMLHFLRLAGRGESLARWPPDRPQGRLCASAVARSAGRFRARQLNVLIEGQQGQRSGIEGVVRIEPALP
jgi:beta-galactosidase